MQILPKVAAPLAAAALAAVLVFAALAAPGTGISLFQEFAARTLVLTAALVFAALAVSRIRDGRRDRYRPASRQ